MNVLSRFLAPPTGLKRQGLVIFSAWRALQTFGANPQAAEQIVSLLGRLKGPFMKIGQVLASIPGFLPPVLQNSLTAAYNQGPTLPQAEVEFILETFLGQPWSTVFHHIEWAYPASGSFAQVHKAILLDGTPVACKIQYPHITSALKTDLGLFNTLCTLYDVWGPGIHTKNLREELEYVLLQELDYLKEGASLTWFSDFFKEDPWIQTPDYYPEYSNSSILTLSWMEGQKFSALEQENQEVRDHFAPLLLRFLLKPFFQEGILHADLHEHHYRWTPQGKLQVIDFGCVYTFPASFVQGIKEMYFRLRDQKDTIPAYDLLGFQNLSKEHKTLLDQWARFLLSPFLKPGVHEMENTMAQGLILAKTIHHHLRKSGGITIPRHFLFFDRCIIAVGSALIRLRARQNWAEALESFLFLDCFI